MSDSANELRDVRIRAFSVGAAHLCEAFQYYAAARRTYPTTVLRPLDELADRAIAAEDVGDHSALKAHLAKIKETIASNLAAHSLSDSAFAEARNKLEQAAACIMKIAPRPALEVQ